MTPCPHAFRNTFMRHVGRDHIGILRVGAPKGNPVPSRWSLAMLACFMVYMHKFLVSGVWVRKLHRKQGHRRSDEVEARRGHVHLKDVGEKESEG